MIYTKDLQFTKLDDERDIIFTSKLCLNVSHHIFRDDYYNDISLNNKLDEYVKRTLKMKMENKLYWHLVKAVNELNDILRTYLPGHAIYQTDDIIKEIRRGLKIQ